MFKALYNWGGEYMPHKSEEQRKAYGKAYNAEWYKRNRDERRAQINKRQDGIVAWMSDYKSRLSCVRCGESDPVCLQFHHRDQSKKDLEVSTAVTNGWGVDRIKAEIEKCDVLCANCHFKEHRDQHKSMAGCLAVKTPLSDSGDEGSIPSLPA